MNNSFMDTSSSLTEEDLHNRKLLTVEIPDNGFLQWDKNTDYSIVEAARDRLYNYLIENDEDGSYEGNAKDYLKKELEYTFNAQMTGQNLYQTLTSYLNSERTTSKFLNEMGVKNTFLIPNPLSFNFDKIVFSSVFVSVFVRVSVSFSELHDKRKTKIKNSRGSFNF